MRQSRPRKSETPNSLDPVERFYESPRNYDEAKDTHMTEVITRPSKGATKAPARKKSAPAVTVPVVAPQQSEADQLLSKAARVIGALIVPLTNCYPWNIYSGWDQVNAADDQLMDLGKTAEEWTATGEEGPQPSNIELIMAASGNLNAAQAELLNADDFDANERLLVVTLITNAIPLVARLHEAYAGLPGSIEDLRALTTFAGARPHGDRPMPPIRREPESAQATHLHHAKDVQTVFETLATQALTLRDFLLDARTKLDTNKGTVRAANDMLVAQHLAAFIGSMADEMGGGRYIGSPASWATMDGIEPIGGAA